MPSPRIRRLLVGGQLALLAAARGNAQAVAVHPDPRIELLTIVFRLAGAGEYDQCRVPSYAAAIDSAFAPWRNHPAIQMAQRIRDEHEIGFDAVPNFALSLSMPPDLKELVPPTDERWAGPHYHEFAVAVRDFVRDSRFMAFYSRERHVYEAAAKGLDGVVRATIHPAWFTSFFGPHAGAQFIAIPGTCNGGANYGPHVSLPGGHTAFYAIIGISDTTSDGQPLVTAVVAPTIVHEFAHSYANPFIERHFAEMQTSAAATYAAVAGVMARQAYGDGATMLKESLVRAAVVRYRRANEGPAAAGTEMREQFGRGFLWIRGLDSLLARYEARRDQYPTFESYMPEVVQFFNGVAASMPERLRQLEAARPRLLSVAPADSAADLDPATAAIVLTFDRPMSGGYSFNRVSGKGAFPDLTTPSWNTAHTEFTMYTHLKPGQAYDLVITGAGFQSVDGIPLAERTWHFQTRP